MQVVELSFKDKIEVMVVQIYVVYGCFIIILLKGNKFDCIKII